MVSPKRTAGAQLTWFAVFATLLNCRDAPVLRRPSGYNTGTAQDRLALKTVIRYQGKTRRKRTREMSDTQNHQTSQVRFRSDKSYLLAKSPPQALSTGTLLLPACLFLMGTIYVLPLQSDPLGILASSLLSSKDIASAQLVTVLLLRDSSHPQAIGVW